MGEIINPGTFDRKVNLYRQTVVRTASGEVVKSFTLHTSCFASVVGKTLSEESDVAVRPVLVQEMTTHIVRDISNAWRVEVDGEMYEIISVDTLERRYTKAIIKRLNV